MLAWSRARDMHNLRLAVAPAHFNQNVAGFQLVQLHSAQATIETQCFLYPLPTATSQPSKIAQCK